MPNPGFGARSRAKRRAPVADAVNLMTTAPKIMVVGLGGIGGIVAAHLMDAGYEVTGVSANAEVRRALAAGFRVDGAGRSFTARGKVVESPPPTARYDFVLLATQPPQVEAAARRHAGALAEQGAMVVFQNGLCEERVADIVGASRVVGAIISWGASMIAPGHFRRTSRGGFTVGALVDGLEARRERLAEALRHVGPVAATDNLRGARWSKLAFNCAVSSLGTVGGDRLGPLLARSFVRRLGLEVMTEAVEVARAEGVVLEKLAGTVDLERLALSDRERAGQGRWSLRAKHAVLLAAGARYRRLRSSMLAAIERGRPPAVDFLNGEITGRADRYGLRTPVNAALRRTVHRIAAGEARSSVSTLREIFEDTRPKV